jgi:hypothetical protein
MAGRKRKIPDGNGGVVECDYDELKSRLKNAGSLNTTTANLLINKYFPEEYELEKNSEREARAKKNELTLQDRWKNWFSEECKEASRRLVEATEKEQRAFGTDVLIRPNGFEPLLRKAQRAADDPCLLKSTNRITDFSSWIFRLNHPERRSSMEFGKVGETFVQRAKAARIPGKIYDPNWKLLFVDDFSEHVEPLVCNSLQINGRPLYGRPDYVFFNASSETALIIEVKTSWRDLPADGWANLRAQLWGYGQLDLVLECAKQIVLIGEVWSEVGPGHYKLRQTYRWDLWHDDFYKDNLALFECYQRFTSSKLEGST